MKASSLLIAIVLAIVPVAARAASDGTLGATSTGSTGLSVTVPGIVRIRLLANIALGTWSGTGNKTANDSVCVYSNLATGTYQVTATGNGTAGAFTLASGGNTLPYHVYWNDVANTTGNVEVTSGVVLGSQTGASTNSACSANTANYQITILAVDLAAATSGAYTGIVSFVVAPV